MHLLNKRYKLTEFETKLSEYRISTLLAKY